MHDNANGHIKTVSIEKQNDDKLCHGKVESCYRLLERNPFLKLLHKTNSTAENFAINSALTADNSEENEVLSKQISCKQFGSDHKYTSILEPIDQSILVCRGNNTGWYPNALFSYNNTDCQSFKQPFSLRTLDEAYGHIHKMLGA